MNKEELKQFLLSLWRDGFISEDFDNNMDNFNYWFDKQIQTRLTSEEVKKLNY